MASYDFSSARLCVDDALKAGASITLEANASNYVRNVLRLQEGSRLLVFNGRDGEWLAEITTAGKKCTVLLLVEQTRPQHGLPDIWYLFAPLKHARLDYMVQKAVEMGASLLQPVITRRTQAARVNTDRMRANAVEAAEQCGILALAEVENPRKLADVLAGWSEERVLVFCDEDAELGDSLRQLDACRGKPLAVLIGPEGGFDPAERALLLEQCFTLRLSLGPRILRADTAAVAALTVVQAVCGDWKA
jgi:16S rRNA (uracil1498-N3)-methyltransferase